MTCTVRAVINQIQDTLVDKEGVRYTDARLLAWLNMALVDIYAKRPDLFGEPMQVTLQPGCVQNFCSQCPRVIDVLYTDGNECAEPTQEEQEKSNLLDFLGPDCCGDAAGDEDTEEEAFAIRDYTLDAERPCFLRIKGDGVPDDGETYTAWVICVKPPAIVCIGDKLPDIYCNRFLSCIPWFVMGYAMALNDASSGTSLNRSQIYMQNYGNCMNAIARGDYALEKSKYFLIGRDEE